MFCAQFGVGVLILSSVFVTCFCQEYDFAAEISRQCLVPDPVGLLDCVENKVTLPYLTSWVDCTNSLGQNVRTSADIINYRCKSVWEGKGVIPEVFYIKDCVIEKTGLPAKNVSAEVLGAYKECESTPKPQQQNIKTAAVQQQQLRVSSVEYRPQTQQFQAPPTQQLQAPPTQQFQAPPTQQFQAPQTQQFQTQVLRVSPQPVQVQIPIQKIQASVFNQPQNRAPVQSFQYSAPRPTQPQMPAPVQRPIQEQFQVMAPIQLTNAVPVQFNHYPVPVAQYQRRAPISQQYFAIYPQVQMLNQQQKVNNPIMSQKTAAFVPQQQILTSASQASLTNLNVPYSYSFQIIHPQKTAL